MSLPPTGCEDVQRRVLRDLGRSVLRIGLAVGLALALFVWAAIPNFGPGGGRLNPNESTAIATLENIASAQEQFRRRGSIDRDGDGLGEYGWFAELAGGAEPVLSHAFAAPVDGCVTRSGYRFRMWLPTGNGAWAHAGQAVPSDRDGAEQHFGVHAWPIDKATGKRAFFVGENGDVLATKNTDWLYSGASAPPIDAALPSSDAGAERGDWGHVGCDGRQWIVVD